MNIKDYKEQAFGELKERAVGVRLRAWSLSLMFATALIFYLLMTVTFKDKINPVDIVIMFAIQWLVSVIWFPEGILHGEKDGAYKANRGAYNKRATFIATEQKTGKLREFCKIDFAERKQRYIEKMLGRISIEVAEFEILRQMPKEVFAVKKRTLWELMTRKTVVDNAEISLGEDKKILLNDTQKRVLTKLIFEEINIEPNNPDTIMCAMAIDEQYAIRNEELIYKRKVKTLRLLQSSVGALILAYIGYQFKDGLSFEVVARAFIYLTTFFMTIVMSFVQGEESIKTHKNQFLLKLINFIDRFFEYAEIKPIAEEKEVSNVQG